MLLNLINDLLDLAKLENQKFHINEEYFDLNKLVEQAFKTFKIQAEEKNIDLIYEKCIKLSEENCRRTDIDLDQILE